ncbi:MAG: DUF5712 family protein [Tunicatimonas sp.]|uniref:DUF5712 family protein n=1 Tax=Tunicatimonas sp. TaxID=1940096 RepID=UPI003C70997A
MHSKIINPKQHGRFVFSNRGSCKKTVSYLGHEVQEQPGTAHFFHQHQDAITADEVREVIDRNARGLGKQQEKFYSLVLSPSFEELAHLQNDPKKLKAFTMQVMENYAHNFRFTKQPDKKLTGQDVVWFATIHQTRIEKQGDTKGHLKPGFHTHIHVLVSAQNQERSLRLNPRSYRSRFSIKDWQTQNGKDFQQLFDYQKATISEKLTAPMPPEEQLRYQRRIGEKVAHLNQYFTGHWKLDENKVLKIGKAQHYGKGFFFRLHHLTQRYQQGKLVNNPYHMLETGKDEPFRLPEYTLLKLGKQSQSMGEVTEESLDRKRKKKQTQQQPQVER